MQALLNDFAAKQPREDSQAAEENPEPQIEELEDAGEHLSIGADRTH